LAEEELEEFLVELKLPTEEKLVQSLIDLKLLPQEKMFEPLENLELKHDQGKRSPQVDSPMFLLQVINEELMPV
jgi:hypothetical protein